MWPDTEEGEENAWAVVRGTSTELAVHSRVAAGQVAELGQAQAPSRYAEAIEPVFQANHQGTQGRGQSFGVPCGGHGVSWVQAPSGPRVHTQLAPLPNPYLSSQNQGPDCPHPPGAGRQGRPRLPSGGHSPSTAADGGEEAGQ